MSRKPLNQTGTKGSPAMLRAVALLPRHPAGVKEPVSPMSPEKIRAAIDAGTCPWCGRGPFAMLPVHTNKTHGVDKWELRELAELSTNDPLCSPELRERLSTAFKSQPPEIQKDRQRRATEGSRVRKGKRWTTTGRARVAQNLPNWERRNPEAARQARVAAGRLGGRASATLHGGK